LDYNQKEKLASSFNHNFNFTEQYIKESQEHYELEEVKRKTTKAKFNLFTYIKESTYAYEINKYIINNKLEPPTEDTQLDTILESMYMEGFIFTQIKKNARQQMGRQIIQVYRKKQNSDYKMGENDILDLSSKTDQTISYKNFHEQENLCSYCSS